MLIVIDAQTVGNNLQILNAPVAWVTPHFGDDLLRVRHNCMVSHAVPQGRWRVEADAILAAMEKAKQSDAWAELTDQERAGINLAMNQVILAYHHDDYLLLHAMIERRNHATMTLAENMMNSAVRGALKGTKI